MLDDGALLIGTGIIVILAHNWTQLSRPVRALLSFVPLLTGQALCAWTLLRKRQSLAWREGSTTFLTLAIGASLALISQTYQISGSFSRLLLAWTLLALPLAYLFSSGVSAGRGRPGSSGCSSPR